MSAGTHAPHFQGAPPMTAVFDHAGSLRRMGNDSRLFQEMIGFLSADSPKLIARAVAGYETGDWPQVERAAHTLKGLVSNFGATRATTAAANVEQSAKLADSQAVGRLLPELKRAVQELQAALEPFAADGD